MVIRIATALFGIVFAASALAQKYDIAPFGIGAPSGIIGESDDRQVVDPKSRPYVVKIYNMMGFLCNGSVVAPKTILTAAHCVQLPRDSWRTPNMQPYEIVTWKGTSFGVDKVNIAPDYGEFPSDDPQSISDDIAFIKTTGDPVPETGIIQILGSRKLKNGDGVELVGFSPSTSRLKIQWCVADVYFSSFAVDRIEVECDSEPGLSGSPVIVRRNGTEHVAGVLSGGNNRRGYNYAALLDDDGHEKTYEFVKEVVRGASVRPASTEPRYGRILF